MPTGQLIVVVNDDDAFLELMDELLTDEGFRTITAKSSQTAYQTIRDVRPALVLLDVRIDHHASGWELLELLRLDPETARMPVVVMSADSRFLRENEQRLRAHGYDILEKPFDLDELVRVVHVNLPSP